MKETTGRDASQKVFWKHAKDQVVGQIFFAATTRVDTYKLKFNQVIALHSQCLLVGLLHTINQPKALL